MKTITYDYQNGKEIIPGSILESVIDVIEGMRH